MVRAATDAEVLRQTITEVKRVIAGQEHMGEEGLGSLSVPFGQGLWGGETVCSAASGQEPQVRGGSARSRHGSRAASPGRDAARRRIRDERTRDAGPCAECVA